jgi:uncharacterized coiled-coil protein SlyX
MTIEARIERIEYALAKQVPAIEEATVFETITGHSGWIMRNPGKWERLLEDCSRGN